MTRIPAISKGLTAARMYYGSSPDPESLWDYDHHEQRERKGMIKAHVL